MDLALSSQQAAVVQSIIQKFPIIQQIAHALQQKGGKAFFVGGVVRDIILGSPISDVDIDIEVHGVSSNELELLLQQFGPVSHVGKSFGVFKIAHIPIDWSLPRVDSAGRKPHVTIVENLSIKDALRRRDVTMNAMAIDVHSRQLHDPFGGLEDIKNKVLRSPDAQFFTQDPLRFYRVMQFIGRFEMYPDETLQQVCKTMDIATISRERIEMEFHKLFLKSRQPSRGIRWLNDLGRIEEILPEVAQLKGIIQDPKWHPEGDVFEHTMQALDAAAASFDPAFAKASAGGQAPLVLSLPKGQDERVGVSEKLAIMYAALCHDLGKTTTTTVESDGRVRSIGHEVAGVPLAKSLLKRITVNKTLMDVVCVLVHYHMRPGQLVTGKASLAAYKRLARDVAPLVNLKMLSMLAYADKRGRNPQKGVSLTDTLPDVDTFMQRAQDAGVYFHPEPPILQGADLLDEVAPGPVLGKLLAKAYEIQIDKGITDKELLKKRVMSKKSSL